MSPADRCTSSEIVHQDTPSQSCGCRPGEAVTISYGPWPNDVFYLFFGFVPDDNPHDTIVMFHDLQEMVELYDDLVAQRLSPPASASSPASDSAPAGGADESSSQAPSSTPNSLAAYFSNRNPDSPSNPPVSSPESPAADLPSDAASDPSSDAASASASPSDDRDAAARARGAGDAGSSSSPEACNRNRSKNIKKLRQSL